MTGPLFKCTIYILISALTALSTELSKYDNLSEITDVKWGVLLSGVILQCLIAVRAFIDQSISKESTSTLTPKEESIESTN
jgi:hypothetical protein